MLLLQRIRCRFNRILLHLRGVTGAEIFLHKMAGTDTKHALIDYGYSNRFSNP